MAVVNIPLPIDWKGEVHMWFANRDFKFPNLTVDKYHTLPKIWQTPDKIHYLKMAYGADCVIFKEDSEVSPITVIPERKRGTFKKKDNRIEKKR